jgi:hypothetical protein
VGIGEFDHLSIRLAELGEDGSRMSGEGFPDGRWVLDANTITNSDAWTPDPPQENPGGAPGITQRFVHRDSTAAIAKSRTILTTIQFLPDHDAATRSTAASENSMNNWLANTETQQVPLGDGGSGLSGLIPDTYQYLQAIYFTVGNAAVSLQLAGAYASGPNLDAAPGIDSAGGGFVFNYAAGQAAHYSRTTPPLMANPRWTTGSVTDGEPRDTGRVSRSPQRATAGRMTVIDEALAERTEAVPIELRSPPRHYAYAAILSGDVPMLQVVSTSRAEQWHWFRRVGREPRWLT